MSKVHGHLNHDRLTQNPPLSLDAPHSDFPPFAAIYRESEDRKWRLNFEFLLFLRPEFKANAPYDLVDQVKGRPAREIAGNYRRAKGLAEDHAVVEEPGKTRV
ncbi:hypothetical protein B0A55_06020, partial [Friedmanniomyces simplex]